MTVLCTYYVVAFEKVGAFKLSIEEKMTTSEVVTSPLDYAQPLQLSDHMLCVDEMACSPTLFRCYFSARTHCRTHTHYT